MRNKMIIGACALVFALGVLLVGPAFASTNFVSGNMSGANPHQGEYKDREPSVDAKGNKRAPSEFRKYLAHEAERSGLSKIGDAFKVGMNTVKNLPTSTRDALKSQSDSYEARKGKSVK